MHPAHRPRIFLSPVLAAAAAAAFSTLLPTSLAVAQQLPPIPLQFNPDTYPNPGRPGGRRRGGGSRGSCQTDGPLTAITPAHSITTEELGITRTDDIVGSLTTRSQPTLWFYLPQPISGDTVAELTIKDSREQLLFQGQLSGTTDDSGIIGIPTPISLAPGESYHWFLTLACDESESITVDGWLERRLASADLRRTFNQANDRNRAALYAHYGFVQDSLSELAALRLAHPEDEAVTQAWNSLLSTLDLSDLIATPLWACCQIINAGSPEDGAEREATEITVPNGPESASESIEGQSTEGPDSRTLLQRIRDRERD